MRTKVIVFSLSAAMAGLGGVFYAGQQGGIGATDVQFIGSLTLLLFVAIWGIRTMTGALLGRHDGRRRCPCCRPTCPRRWPT